MSCRRRRRRRLSMLKDLHTAIDKRADGNTGLGSTLDVDAAEFDRMSTRCGEQMRWRR
jgi:hypothetical protein